MPGAVTLSRRTLLRGLGTAVSLPLLEAMVPSTARSASTPAAKPPVRMAFLYVPNGVHMEDWTPAEPGDHFKMPSILEPVAEFRDQMTLFSRLGLNGANSLGDGPGDHARSVAAFLTGAHPKKTGGKDIKNGVSVDQAAAEKIGHLTKFPSLELGLEGSAQSGSCDSGYSCIYSSNMSWRTPESPVAKETKPGAVFDRLFGDQQQKVKKEEKDQPREHNKSVLDFVLEDARGLRNKLGERDKQKLDEYLHAVREVEHRITNTERLIQVEEGVPDYPRPAGSPRDFSQHCRLMFDMMALALQTDSTRILTFMYANAGSNRRYGEVEASDGHHSLSHHGNDAKKTQQISRINQFHMGLFAHLLKRLSAVEEPGGGTLLDNSMLLYGSGIGDGNRHNHLDLPIALFGKGGGRVTAGRHVVCPTNTPLTNLYLSMLDAVGADSVKQLGDSTGRLDSLRV